MSYLRVSDVSWVPIVEKCGSGQNVFVIRIFLKAYISWISIYLVFNKANYLIYIIKLYKIASLLKYS